MKRLLATANAFVAIQFLGVSLVPAQTFTWLPTTGGLYNAAANWSPAGGPPNAAGEIALFNNGATQTVVYQTNVTTGGHAIDNGDVTFQLDGTTQTITGAGTALNIGSIAGQTGRLTLLNGTMTGDLSIGNVAASSGILTLGANATFDAAANPVTIASSINSVGTLNVTDGGSYTGTANFAVGSSTGSNGSVTVSGTGSSLVTSGTVIVGSSGTGAMTVSGGGSITGSIFLLGDTATASGSLTVTGAGSTVSSTNGSGNLSIGDDGTGTLLVSAGGTFTTTSASRIGANASGTGTVTVTGAGSTWNASNLAVGGSIGANGGTGTLVIEDDGVVNVSLAMEIRATAGSAVTIDGGTLNVAGNFTKNSTLNLRDGTLHVVGTFDNGTASAQLVIDGPTANKLPTLHLSGGGNLAEVTNITVGNVNRGALLVDGGRNLALGANNLLIGTTATGNGSVTVTGSNSTISTTNTISIGGNAAVAQGVGSLNISQNGFVSAGTLNVFPQGTLTIDNGTLSASTLSISNGATVNFVKGRVNFTASSTNLTASIVDGLLGPTHELGAGRTIGGGASTFTLQTPLTINGGMLASGSGGPLANSSTLVLNSGAVNADGTFTNNSGATFEIGSSGSVSSGSILNQGTILLDHNLQSTGTTSLTNFGIIRGSGVLNNSITNAAAGQIQVTTGNRMEFTAAGASNTFGNAGIISVDGGELAFATGFGNSSGGLLSGRNGVIRGGSVGITNGGAIAFSGGSMDVYGDVTQGSGGRITITGGGVTTFYDDVTISAGANNIQVSAVGSVVSSVIFLGSYNGGTTGGGAAFIEGDHRPGNSPALVNFGGDVFYGGASDLFIEIGGTAAGSQFDKVAVANQLSVGGTLNVSLINGFAPVAGQSFDILDFTSLTGTFNTITLPLLAGGLSWNTSQLYTTGTLSVVGGIPGDYNNNGVVDAADYVLWRKGGPLANEVDTPGVVNAADYTAWRARFGNTSGSGTGSVANVAEFLRNSDVAVSEKLPYGVVPEPSTSWLLLITLALAAHAAATRRNRIAGYK